ncbi:GNAT family N-acetyltransferase [Desertivirga arenae]|uniref:GNAT family N-acetyltransferase n=1 Tax=Desertivirga arenae TaxID=2810309 RepID=UPI001A957DEC|nr:GNAT family N-acetyltransferase [Pedobacter sp. SYSU D00823]
MKILYKVDLVPQVDDIIEVYKSSGIIRPTSDRDRILKMYSNSNLVVTAWHQQKLIGVARSLTDYCYCCYLSDLAVRKEYQKSGIGRKLIELTREKIGEETALILLSAPSAMEYYPKAGFEKVENGFLIRRMR